MGNPSNAPQSSNPFGIGSGATGVNLVGAGYADEPQSSSGFDIGYGAAAGVGLEGAGINVGGTHSILTGETQAQASVSFPGVEFDPSANTTAESLEGLRDETLEPGPINRGCTRAAQIIVA